MDDVPLWEFYCPRLKRFYEHEELCFLVGAGLSYDSGLPGWDDLNRALLRQSLKKLQAELKLSEEGLRELADALYKELGHDAATDFVWNRAGNSTSFFHDLTGVLYNGRTLASLRTGIAHRQLAAMKNARLFTLNFDPLLELALQRAEPATESNPPAPRQYRCTDLASHRNGSRRNVCHLHGWIDPDGFRGGSFVLTESHYFELYSRPHQQANTVLDGVLTSGGAVIIIGMSLTDGNLRRQLYLRSRNQLSDSTEIYAILKSKGNQQVDSFQAQHWASRGVSLIYIKDWDDIPTLLREIRFGPADNETGAYPWMTQSLEWLRSQLPDERLYSDAWQQKAHDVLRELRQALAETASPQSTNGRLDTLQISLLGPVSETEIAILADARQSRSGEAARAHSEKFRLRVGQKKPQGVSGVAFGLGKPAELRDDASADKLNFTEAMQAYSAQHNLLGWRSILSVPILDSADVVPVATCTLESTDPEPFWAGLNPANRRNLHHILRKTGKQLIAR